MLRSPHKHLLIKAKAVSLTPSPPAALHNEDAVPVCSALLNSHTWGSLGFGVRLPRAAHPLPLLSRGSAWADSQRCWKGLSEMQPLSQAWVKGLRLSWS